MALKRDAVQPISSNSNIKHNRYCGPLPTLAMNAAMDKSAKLLLRSDSWEYAAQDVLATLGVAAGVSGIGLFKSPRDDGATGKTMRCIYQWCLEANTNMNDVMSPAQLYEVETLTYWLKELQFKEAIKVTAKAANSVEALFLNAGNILSLVIVPLRVNGVLWGALLLYEKRVQREWSHGNIVMIRSIAELFGAAIEGNAIQKALKETEKRFQVVARATNDAIYDWDLLNDNCWRSPNTEILFGYSMAEIRANPNWWKQSIHPADRSRILGEISEFGESGKGFWTAEYRFRRSNGQYMYVLDRAYIAFSGERPVRMIGSIQDITQQKQYEVELEESRDQLRKLVSCSQLIREKERKHLARELHDEFAQLLTAIKYNLDWMKSRMPQNDDKLKACLVETTSSVLLTMNKIKHTAMQLRPVILDDLGLVEAVKWQLTQYQKRWDCKIGMDIMRDKLVIDKETEVAVFRIFQEALSNVSRHAKATKVDVRLQKGDGLLEMQIKDDGVGIEDDQISDSESIGLLGMRERANALGGDLTIQRLPYSDGTSVLLQIPIGKERCI